MRRLSILSALLMTTIVLPVGATPGHAAGVFNALYGTWSGGGKVRLANGKSERLRCKAYYTKRGSSGLGLAIRCASPSNKIHMRGSLNQNGSSVSGNWEERTFNANGRLNGSATGSSVRLSISGSISGSLSISLNGNNQTVSLSTGGNELQGVSLKFSRR